VADWELFVADVVDKIDLKNTISGLLTLGQFGEGTIIGVDALLDAEAVFDNVVYTQGQRNELLKWATGFVVRLRVFVACYPLGYVTELLFDDNGDPL
jgi:hypothetical protein